MEFTQLKFLIKNKHERYGEINRIAMPSDLGYRTHNATNKINFRSNNIIILNNN